MISSSHQKPYLLIYQLHNLTWRFSYTSSSLTVGNSVTPALLSQLEINFCQLPPRVGIDLPNVARLRKQADVGSEITPTAAINLWSFVLKRKQADFGSGITPTAAIVSICVLSWSLLVTTANLVRTDSLHLINHWGSWNDATIPSHDEFKMYFTNAHAEILFLSTHSVCLVNATAVNWRLSRAGRCIAQIVMKKNI